MRQYPSIIPAHLSGRRCDPGGYGAARGHSRLQSPRGAPQQGSPVPGSDGAAKGDREELEGEAKKKI